MRQPQEASVFIQAISYPSQRPELSLLARAWRTTSRSVSSETLATKLVLSKMTPSWVTSTTTASMSSALWESDESPTVTVAIPSVMARWRICTTIPRCVSALEKSEDPSTPASTRPTRSMVIAVNLRLSLLSMAGS